MIELFNNIVSDIKKVDCFRQAIRLLQEKDHLEISAAVGSLKSILAAEIYQSLEKPILWVFESQDKAQDAKIDLEHLLPVKVSALFPMPRKSKWGHDDVYVVSQQAEALETLSRKERQILLISQAVLETRVKSPKEIASKAIKLTTGSERPFNDFIKNLNSVGFMREPTAEKPGDMAIRGGIIDVYPFTAENPVRIEFWGDTVESIREFDSLTQRSTEKLEKISIFPKPEASADSHDATVIDFLPPDAIVLFDDAPAIEEAVTGATPPAEFDHLAEDHSRDDELWQVFLNDFEHLKSIFFTPFKARYADTKIEIPARHPKPLNGDIKLLVSEFSLNGQLDRKNYFLCESPGHAQRMRDLFDDYNLTESDVTILGLNLSRGFCLPDHNIHVYTDHEFYSRRRRHRGRRKLKEGLTLKQLKALNMGDFVTHADHGIARFIKLEKITVAGHERECLLLEYKEGDKLYVPLDRMDRVQKYTGKDGTVPKIHKLGTGEWERLKKRTKSKLKDIAEELVKLYSLRKSQTGFAFSPDTTWQKELEASFPYEDTPDQNRAAAETKIDMEKDQPMDRLVCGDVGYGKTEVAVRAAFKAVQDGKQVAVLVPTTILAEQHYFTFSERLEKFPVKIEVLSRFRTAREQKKIVEHIKTGQVDIVIGTHRLISKDIEFKNLGLLVVDEEQRFGVRHKERLKHLRVNVDVLSLSATPIPRTLHMSLIGVRDMSLINTPPRDRLPVETETMEFDPKFIREAILYEMQRGGQVFFVHNRVESIYTMAARLADIVPEADIVVGHGKMKGMELENVIMDFMRKKYHVLVSTMIIEAGMDMPNVNTIFINRADRFGLAQLYQLRGRVGRSWHKAYCYLIVPPLRSLKPEAIRRLETIEEFTDLGSGIQIALRDLEIRGAGNVLGAEQSGFIDQVGFETYMKILEESIRELMPQEAKEQAGESFLAGECRVDADVDAYLPQKYVELPVERVDIYRRLAHAAQHEEIDAILEEVQDRFGRLPEEAANLFYIAKARLLGRLAGFRRLVIKGKIVTGYFSEKLTASPREKLQGWLTKIIKLSPREVEFAQEKELVLRLTAEDDKNPLEVLVGVLESIAAADKI
jgi:transcription-repair coupling factor (superfamily II helicase)